MEISRFCEHFLNQIRSKLLNHKTILENDNSIKKKLNNIILNSCNYEGDNSHYCFDDIIINYLTNLSSDEPLNLNKLVSIFREIGTDDEGVGVETFEKNGSSRSKNEPERLESVLKLIRMYNIGAKASDITMDKLQNFINSFYKTLSSKRTYEDVLRAFKYYIVFEQIHPFEDCNGRIGRLVFLEHPFEYVNFPVSNALNKFFISQDDLFESNKNIYYYKDNKLYDYKINEEYVYKKYNFDETDLKELNDKQKIKINEIIVKSIIINLYENKFTECLKKYFKYVSFTSEGYEIDYDKIDNLFETWKYKFKIEPEQFYTKFP